MGEEPGFVENQFRHLREVGDGRRVPELRKFLLGDFVAALGLVAQCEQRLFATSRGTSPCDFKNLLAVQIGTLPRARGTGESAVVADVTAEVSQGNEDFARIRDQLPVTGIADLFSRFNQRLKIGFIRERESGFMIRVNTLPGARQGRTCGRTHPSPSEARRARAVLSGATSLYEVTSTRSKDNTGTRVRQSHFRKRTEAESKCK